MSESCEVMKGTVSIFLVDPLMEWRNEAPEDMTRKFLGGLGCAAIVLLAVIETVVRGVLSLLALPFIYCLPKSQNELRGALALYLPIGTLLALTIAATSLNILINSCTSEKIDGNDYKPDCFGDLIKSAGDHFGKVLE